jgi:hypothetical protein
MRQVCNILVATAIACIGLLILRTVLGPTAAPEDPITWVDSPLFTVHQNGKPVASVRVGLQGPVAETQGRMLYRLDPITQEEMESFLQRGGRVGVEWPLPEGPVTEGAE